MRAIPKTVAVLATTAALAVGLIGCSAGQPPVPAGGSTGKSSALDADAYSTAISKAPVASKKLVAANAWAAEIKASGVLRVGGVDTSPLFSLKDPTTGKLTGFDAGLSQMLAKYILGTPKTSLSAVSVDTRETLLQNNAVDAVFATYSITPARAEKIAFAGPYFDSGAAIMVKKDDQRIKSYRDLAGKTVVTESGSTAITTLNKFAPDAKQLLFQENAQCVAAVQQGRADAYVIDQSILLSAAVSNSDVKVVGAPFTTDPYGIGVTKSTPAAKAFVNAWLTKIEQDGSWKRLWESTVGTVVEGAAPTPPAIGSVAGS